MGCLVAHLLLIFGCVVLIAMAIVTLPEGRAVSILPTVIAGQPVSFFLSPEALWLLGFGLAPAALACAASTPPMQPRWLAVRDSRKPYRRIGCSRATGRRGFLISWEIMGLGGAVMLLSERLSADSGKPVLFMLGLLEVGAVALLALCCCSPPKRAASHLRRFERQRRPILVRRPRSSLDCSF